MRPQSCPETSTSNPRLVQAEGGYSEKVCASNERRWDNLRFSLADFVCFIQKPSRVHYNFCISIAQVYVVTPQLLNQMNKIGETELYIYPSSFVISTYLLLKAPLRLHQTRVCRTGFRATLFALNFCLGEFLLPAFANRFELRCEPKLLYHKICPCCTTFLSPYK